MSVRTKAWAIKRRRRCTTHKPFLATLLVFDIQHDPSYNMPGCIVDEQRLPRPVGVHLILADPWSKERGQPQE
jgi:hypothetical protein